MRNIYVGDFVKKLNVLIITKEYNDILSGAGRYAIDLIDGVLSKGHNVSVLCPNTNQKLEQNNDLDIYYFSNSQIDLRHGNWMLVSSKINQELSKIQKNNKFDVIHFAEARDALFFKNITNTPIVGTVHDYHFANATKNFCYYKRVYSQNWFQRYLYYNFGHFLEHKIVGKMDRVITSSLYVANSTIKEYNLKQDKLSVIYNGIRSENVSRFSSKNKPIVLFVGNNFQGKGLQTLIKSSKTIINSYPNVQFVVVGNDPNSKNNMINMCNKLNVLDNFKFKNHLEHHEVYDLYKSSTVLAYPSLADNFPYTILESMVNGLPVVSTYVGGIKEMISQNENGFLIETFDYFSLAKYIIKLISDTELWDNISKNGINTAKKFSYEDMIEKTINVYYQCLK